jgi:hypothetical protein
MIMGGGFTPARIGSMALWFSSSYGVEGSNGDPAEDTDAVQYWRKRGGDCSDAEQATSGNRPIYRTGQQNGKPCLRFDNTDDFLAGTITLSALPVSVFAVLKTSNTGTEGIFDSSDTLVNTNRSVMFLHDASSMIARVGGNAGAGDAALAHSDTTNVRIWTATYQDGASGRRIYRDAGGVGDNATNTTAPAPIGQAAAYFRIGRLFQDVYPFGGDLYELIIYRKLLSTEERNALVGWAAREFAISV